jgi:hypothetical protein
MLIRDGGKGVVCPRVVKLPQPSNKWTSVLSCRAGMDRQKWTHRERFARAHLRPAIHLTAFGAFVEMVVPIWACLRSRPHEAEIRSVLRCLSGLKRDARRHVSGYLQGVARGNAPVV